VIEREYCKIIANIKILFTDFIFRINENLF